MPPKNMLLIVCDGLSDRPVREFGMKTPLQVAKKPAMDALAKHGLNGTMDFGGGAVAGCHPLPSSMAWTKWGTYRVPPEQEAASQPHRHHQYHLRDAMHVEHLQ